MGQQVKYTYAVIFAAILNFALNSVFLIFSNSGAIGVSIASVLAEFFASILQMYFMKDLINYEMLFLLFKNYFIPSAIMGLCIIMIRILCGKGLLQLVIELIIGVILYIVLLFVRKDKLVLEILKKR